jgi:hypothetical protein
LTICQERNVRLTHKAVAERSAITELATGVAGYVTDLDILVPLASHMSELAVLVLLCSYQLDIGKQHALVTLSKVQVSDCEVSLENVFHTDSRDGRRPNTEGVHCVHDTEVEVEGFSLEERLYCRVPLQDLSNEFELQVNALHAEGRAVNQLVRISDIEGSTEEEVVVCRVLADLKGQVVEEVVPLV